MRLGPVKTHRAEIVAERDGNGGWNRDGGYTGDQALRGDSAQRIELLSTGRAVGDARVLVDLLERRKEPCLVLNNGAAESANIVLTGKRLLGIVHADATRAGLCWIFNGKPGVQRRRALVESCVTVPAVGAALRGDHHGSSGGPACVSVLVRGAHSEFLNAIGREILQKAADPVVGVIGAVDR